MILGAFIRFFKTYRGINFIPITDYDQFCGLVGDNGIGKSSVLESLDTFFNDKNWNLNVSAKKKWCKFFKSLYSPCIFNKKK